MKEVVIKHYGNQDDFIYDVGKYFDRFISQGFFKKIEKYGQKFEAKKLILFIDRKESIIPFYDEWWQIKQNVDIINIYSDPVSNYEVSDNAVYLMYITKPTEINSVLEKLADNNNVFNDRLYLYYKKGINPYKNELQDDNEIEVVNQFTKGLALRPEMEDKLAFAYQFIYQKGFKSIELIQDELSKDLLDYIKILISLNFKVSHSKLREVRLLPLVKYYYLKEELKDYFSKHIKEATFMSNKEIILLCQQAFNTLEIDLTPKSSYIDDFYVTKETKENNVLGRNIYYQK